MGYIQKIGGGKQQCMNGKKNRNPLQIFNGRFICLLSCNELIYHYDH